MKKLLHITLFFLFASGWPAQAQISSGGFPRTVETAFKRAALPVEMPGVNNDILRWEANRQEEGELRLKPLTFAHDFEVHLSPATHGTWNRSTDGWWIWQLPIRSGGALSLNLSFEQFALPENARLFLFTPDKKEILGAYTRENNADDGIFQVSPLPGDELVVQYELPGQPQTAPDFVITRVNHDFLGILKYVDNRRPMGIEAGDCNKDVNCDLSPHWKEVENSVCRIMVQGKDLCTGTLINNTAQNQRPLVLTANHCITTGMKASGSLFLFNYESPHCYPLDGDVSNSLSGSKLKATLDSLDFTLVQLNTPPPPTFRPYFAGWSRNTSHPDTLAAIHHPQGDIKKIAIDYNRPVSSTFLSQFVKESFWKVLKWDVGTTEIGSSGGPLFNKESQVIGTLSGGAAVCGSPVNDYYARFDKAWSYRPDSAHQLKYWLDPIKSGTLSLNGKQFNTKENLCAAFTNLRESETPGIQPVSMVPSEKKGYWTGTNTISITEVADRFDLTDNIQLKGVSLGIGLKSISSPTSNSHISIKIYNFNRQEPVLIYTRDSVYLRNLVAKAMNYIPFTTTVTPDDSFLVAVNFEKVLPSDTIAIYQTMRPTNPVNTLFLKKTGAWIDFLNNYTWRYGASLACELIACNIDGNGGNTIVEDSIVPVRIYPNPTTGRIEILTEYNLQADMVSVHNLLGQEVSFRAALVSPRQLSIDISGQTPGLYLVSVRNGSQFERSKVLLISH